MTIVVTNDRNETLRNVELQATASDPLSIEGSDGAFVAELEPGESADVAFEVGAADGALSQTYPASFDVQYVTPDGETRLSDTYDVPVEVVDPERGFLPFAIGGWASQLFFGLLIGAAIGAARLRRSRSQPQSQSRSRSDADSRFRSRADLGTFDVGGWGRTSEASADDGPEPSEPVIADHESALTAIEGVGPARAAALHAVGLDTPADVARADGETLTGAKGVGPAIAERLRTNAARIADEGDGGDETSDELRTDGGHGTPVADAEGWLWADGENR